MKDAQRRRLLEDLRRRAAAVVLELPELEELARSHGVSTVVAEFPVRVLEPPAEEERSLPSVEPPEPAPPRAPPQPAPPRAPPEPAPSDASEKEPASWPRAWAIAAAVLVSVAAGFSAWLRHERDLHAAMHSVFSLPLASQAGLARHGAALYCLDRTRLLIAAVDSKTGRIDSLKRFPGEEPQGISASAQSLWSAEDTGVVCEHAFDAGYTVLRRFSNPERRPTALHWDGAHLWLADARTGSLYEYSVGASLEPMRQFTLPAGLLVAGIHVDGDLVWVLDAAGRALWRFRARALLEPLDRAPLSPWLAAPRSPTGLLVESGVVWVAADLPPELHKIDAKLLSWRPAS